MAAPRESLGAVPCLCCGQAVPVKKSEKGAISVSCPWCDLSAYAKPGTESYRRIVARMPTKAEPEAPPAKAPSAPPPQAAPAPKKSTFLGL